MAKTKYQQNLKGHNARQWTAHDYADALKTLRAIKIPGPDGHPVKLFKDLDTKHGFHAQRLTRYKKSVIKKLMHYQAIRFKPVYAHPVSNKKLEQKVLKNFGFYHGTKYFNTLPIPLDSNAIPEVTINKDATVSIVLPKEHIEHIIIPFDIKRLILDADYTEEEEDAPYNLYESYKKQILEKTKPHFDPEGLSLFRFYSPFGAVNIEKYASVDSPELLFDEHVRGRNFLLEMIERYSSTSESSDDEGNPLYQTHSLEFMTGVRVTRPLKGFGRGIPKVKQLDKFIEKADYQYTKPSDRAVREFKLNFILRFNKKRRPENRVNRIDQLGPTGRKLFESQFKKKFHWDY